MPADDPTRGGTGNPLIQHTELPCLARGPRLVALSAVLRRVRVSGYGYIDASENPLKKQGTLMGTAFAVMYLATAGST
ncbi:hypothetical protein GDR29_20075 [Xanthomonas oryzae pv. oryzae]|nr:hypothetical protein GDR29_20075 [Xanthomonas oryzae pv. oryzae]